MKHLAKRRHIIITTADKGGAIVIMNTGNYIIEANRQLADKNNYKTFETDSTLQHNKMVNDTLGRLKNENLLSKKTAEELKVQRHPTFYITPKIHKENNAGRPSVCICEHK